MSKNNIAELLKRARKKAGLSQKDVYSILQIPQSTYSSWEVGKAMPDIDKIGKICKILGMSVEEMFEWDTDNFDTTEQKLVNVFRLLDTHGKRTVLAIVKLEHERIYPNQSEGHIIKRVIKVYSQKASAGLGNYLFEDDSYEMKEFNEDIIPPKTSFGIRIKGDSMEPNIQDGQIVFVEALPKLESGDIGIFIYDQEAYCKQLIIDYAQEKIYLHSLNKEYQPIEIKQTEMLKTVGKVIGCTD